jgi:hypothetical protein
MVYVTGDTHGDPERLSKSALKCLNDGDTLIVCGDFGFIWDRSKTEQKILKAFSKRKYNICFIDGTHENFDLLNGYPLTSWNGGKVHQISDNIFHLMRGQIFDIEGLRIFTMGGGESPDIEYRYEMDTWSELEIPTREELIEGVDNLQKYDGKVDLVITHEPPAKIKDFLLLQTGTDASITAINTYLEDVSRICKFKHWYFGSLHLDKFISTSHISVFKNIINAKTGEVVKR